jgi:hypothetical protein
MKVLSHLALRVVAAASPLAVLVIETAPRIHF